MAVFRIVVDDVAGPVDMNGNQVRADQAVGSPELAAATPSGLGRFSAPSVGLDVPLGALNVVNGRIEPPGFTSAYWVSNLGVSIDNASSGTVFVTMHSLRNGGVGPGNFLIDVDGQKAKIAEGSTITVDGVRYTTTKSETVAAASIGQDSAIWANTPNRLVVITCMQQLQGGVSVENLVIEATRDIG